MLSLQGLHVNPQKYSRIYTNCIILIYYLIKTVLCIKSISSENSLKLTSTIHPVPLTEALGTLTFCHLKLFLPWKRKGLQVLQHTSDYKDKCLFSALKGVLIKQVAFREIFMFPQKQRKQNCLQ